MAEELIADHPDLNLLINNAGIMELGADAGQIDDVQMIATITANPMGQIRMPSAPIELGKDAVVA